MNSPFQKVYCITLGRRPDRFQEFELGLPTKLEWPFPRPEKRLAIDGKLVRHPDWWKAGGGAWGCYRSHLQIFEECLNDPEIKSFLIFEDDVIFSSPSSFRQDFDNFYSNVPSPNECMLYLGGQHLHAQRSPPIKLNDYVFKPFNVNRTHCYGIIGRDTMVKVYKHLTRVDWANAFHIDHHLGRLHQERKVPIFTPATWLVGQRDGKSNISGRNFTTRYWAGAKVLSKKDASSIPFVLVLGTHSSGSSCVAMVLAKLGIHMGNELGGYYGGEAKGLTEICEWAAPFPGPVKRPEARIQKRLGLWINQRRNEAEMRSRASKQTAVVGGKYPTLSMFPHLVQNIVGKNLVVINCERDLQESIYSLQKRVAESHPKDPKTTEIDSLQQKIYREKEKFLRQLGPIPCHTVHYNKLLSDPASVIHDLIRFLQERTGADFSAEVVTEAIGLVKPSMRHVDFSKTGAIQYETMSSGDQHREEKPYSPEEQRIVFACS